MSPTPCQPGLQNGLAAAGGSLVGSRLTKAKLQTTVLSAPPAVLLFTVAAKILWDVLA